MNSFPALYGSLEQIHLGPPKSSVEGSSQVPPASKVPPRFSASPAQIRLGLPTASVLKGSMEFAKIVGQILFGVPKGSVEGSPITSLNVSPSSTTLFCIFLNSFRFGLQS